MSVIVNIDQFKQKVRCCRELKIPRYGNLYTHHVFVGKKNKKGCDLYHYTSVSSCLGSSGQITKVHINFQEYRRNTSSPGREIFDLKGSNGDTIYIVERRDYPKDKQTKYECIQRAEKRLGEQSYSACSNNCQSYVNWIFSGDNTSEQTENDFKKNVLGNMVDGASSRGTQHQMAQVPDTTTKVLGMAAEICVELIGNTLEKMVDQIPVQTVSINSLKSVTNSANNIKTLLNSDIVKTKVDSKIREELGKMIKPTNVWDVIDHGPKQNALLEQFQYHAQKQCMRSTVRQAKIETVQKVQEARKAVAEKASNFQISSEIMSLSYKIYSIKTDTNMTDDQKTQSYKREIGSSVGGVAGTLLGQASIPIVGGYLGGFIGNMIGGAISGVL